MRFVQPVLIALIALALAFVPVAGFARTMPAMQHEMSAGAPDDGCFRTDASHPSGADVCILKCCSAVAILVEVQSLPAGRTIAADTVAAVLSGGNVDPALFADIIQDRRRAA